VAVPASVLTPESVPVLARTSPAPSPPVAFVVMANDVTDTLAARAALDRFAALVAGS
jgi:hypothetical protein